MPLVIADTGPINYLILIGRADLFPQLFGQIVLPNAVLQELSSEDAPASVRSWISNPPRWMHFIDSPPTPEMNRIHKGEAAVIALATAMSADLLLMDDRRGVRLAKEKGLRVTGTIGILDLAASRGLVEFSQALAHLEKTSFRRPEALLALLLEKHKKR